MTFLFAYKISLTVPEEVKHFFFITKNSQWFHASFMPFMVKSFDHPLIKTTIFPALKKNIFLFGLT